MDEVGPSKAGSVSITIKPNGPYIIEGPVVVRTPAGAVLTPPPTKRPDVVKLCGCGQSHTQPFCDGTHKLCAPLGEGQAGPEPGSPAL